MMHLRASRLVRVHSRNPASGIVASYSTGRHGLGSQLCECGDQLPSHRFQGNARVVVVDVEDSVGETHSGEWFELPDELARGLPAVNEARNRLFDLVVVAACRR